MNITYIKGDLFEMMNACSSSNHLIIHICNDIGKWGKGFVLAISKKWKRPQIEYLALTEYIMGNVQFIKVESNISVANIIAQKGINSMHGTPICRVDYDVLKNCLRSVNQYATTYKCHIHMPLIGCGLAGGQWSIVSEIIKQTFDPSVAIYVYSLE